MADEPQPQIHPEQEAVLAGGSSGRLISDADEDAAACQPVAGPSGSGASSTLLNVGSVDAAVASGTTSSTAGAAAVPASSQPNAKGHTDEDEAYTAENSAGPQHGDDMPAMNGPAPGSEAIQPTWNHTAETQFQPQNSMMFPQFPPPYPPPHSPQLHHYPLGNNSEMIRFYEAQMRDHAAAYANAAAGAAWAAAHWASQAADYYAAAGNGVAIPPPLPPYHPAGMVVPPMMMMMPQPPPYPPLPTNQGQPFYPPSQMSFQQQQQRLPMMQEDQAFDPQPYSDYHNDFSNNSAENHADQLHPDDENHRRKRQHRVRGYSGNRSLDNNSNDYDPNEEDIPHEITPHQQPDSQNHPRAQHHHCSSVSQYAPQRGRIRRRLRSDNDSSSSGSSFPTNSNNNILRSSRSRHHHHPSKKKKARSDESLIGKTAVSALYEYCGRRQCFPTVTTQQLQVDEFQCIVHLNSFGATPGEEPPEIGRGRGSNKNAAKQEAARRALQALLPGVVFDSATLVTALPVESSPADPPTGAATGTPPSPDQRVHKNTKQQQQQEPGGGGGSSTCVMMDDLAPHLAKQLAIDSSKSSNKRLSSNNSSKGSNNNIPKRSLGGYPSTTTSEGDDPDGDYYSSRGASVCSQLLYAIVQIDRARIVEPPQFTYQVTGSAGSSNEVPARRGSALQASTPAGTSSIFGPRGFSSLTCTGRLKVLSTTVARRHEQNLDQSSSSKDNDDADDPTERRNDDGPDADETTEEILEAVAVGSTKREARHVAAAKLLALLFPECGSDMVKVKAAAEAVRERYAAQKALKQQQQQSHHSVWDSHPTREEEKWSHSTETNPDLADEGLDFAKAQASDPSLPETLAEALQALLQRTEWRTTDRKHAAAATTAAQDAAEEELLVSSVSAVALSDNKKNSPCTASRQAPVHRQVNRQKQLDALVETALQNLNDRDEEGRTLPEELTENDVGRTMLRRAQPEDLPQIRKQLFQAIGGTENRGPRLSRSRSFEAYSSKMPAMEHCMTPPAQHPSFLSMSETDDLPHSTPSAVESDVVSSPSELLTRLRSSSSSSSSSIVLLLCRAIAPHDEDPLGCAVLTIRFSMKHGRSLCVDTIATEPHLPRERFLECLQDFATCMCCHFQKNDEANPNVVLVNEKAAQSQICLSAADLVTIVESHVAANEKPRAIGDPAVRTKRNVLASSASSNSLSMSSQLLPTLLEEQPSEDDASSVEKRMSGQPSRQPSKRSRVS